MCPICPRMQGLCGSVFTALPLSTWDSAEQMIKNHLLKKTQAGNLMLLLTLGIQTLRLTD